MSNTEESKQLTKPIWLIVDIDNNIADNRHRKHLIKDVQNKDWEEFNARAINDEPNKRLIEAIQKFAENPDVKILFITGRNNVMSSKIATYNWLKKQGFQNPHVAFRGSKNFNPNNEIKVINVAYNLSQYELPENFQMIVVEDSQKVLDSFNTVMKNDFKITTLLSDISNDCKNVIAQLDKIASDLKTVKDENVEQSRQKLKM